MTKKQAPKAKIRTSKPQRPEAKTPPKAKKAVTVPNVDPTDPAGGVKSYRPELVKIKVPLQQLLLDPNNPRVLTETEVPEEQYGDAGVQSQAEERMKDQAAGFQLDELAKSITINGWQPVDQIFVKKLDSGHYVVLEGNRRLMALRSIKSMPVELKKQVDPLTVLEVKGAGTIEESRAQVSYLLGVRHHGSLKRWGAFARAHNMYERYLRISGMTDDTFKWGEAPAKRVAETLGVSTPDVKTALKVYRVMKQLSEHPSIKKASEEKCGGIEGKHYSLVREALSERSKGLQQYIKQNAATFRLDAQSVERMEALCQFSAKDRKNAPINNPAEWRPLNKILLDDNEVERARMLKEVEQDKRKPSDVAALRAAALRQPRWDLWLKEVSDLLRRVNVGNLETPDAKAVAGDLAKVLDALAKLVSPSRKVAVS